MKLKTRARPSMKLKMAFLYATVAITLVAAAAWLAIIYLNLGNSEDSLAAPTNYSSAQSGDWNTGATWNGGSSPPTADLTDNIIINSNHDVVLNGTLDAKNGASITINGNATLTINGDMIVQNNLTLMVNGELIINGNLDAKNGAQITVNGSGTVTVTGDASFGNNTNFYVDGVVNIGGDLTFGSNPDFKGNGDVNIVGSGCSNWAGPGDCDENTALPVELLEFILKKHPEGVQVSWKTAMEKNNDYFTIQHSTDGENYTPVAVIEGNGTTQGVSSYAYIDTRPAPGRSYYRLSQTDYDGTTEVFGPAMIELETIENPVSFSVYPNPLRGTDLNVRLSEPASGIIEIQDNNGNRILMKETNGQDTDIRLSLRANMPAGIYYVHFKTSSGMKTARLVKE